MKKIMCAILTLCMLLSTCTFVIAASGDIAGSIYSTDIKACINGVWVDSYNIGGKTVVIVEDITSQYAYSEPLRTLVLTELNPEYLVSGNKAYSQKSGMVVGKIYETDIKTYFRGKELTSYSLNGKMAVVVEELGGDNTFSELGTKFIWNEDERTISVESMYRYPYEFREKLENEHWNIVLEEKDGALSAKIEEAPLQGGNILCEMEIPDNSIIPVFYDGDIIGYRCKFPDVVFAENEDGTYTLENGKNQRDVDYLYTDKISDIISQKETVKLSADDWMKYLENRTLMTVKERFETDEYIFLYAFFAHTHGGTQGLIKLNKEDGKRIDYDKSFESVSLYNQKYFEDVRIDRENEKVYLHYDVDYIIDLKTDEIKAVDSIATDIGIGTGDGQPSAENIEAAKTSQSEYKLTADGEEKLVNGFIASEFYYANMLPLKETFEFLNIGYSFENNLLIIDTSKAKKFEYEKTEKKADIFGETEVNYLYVDKALIDGEEDEITYKYISGHFENTSEGKAAAKPYVCNGKVYINDSFIKQLCDK